MKSKKLRVLFYDIETAPNLSYTWGKYDQNVIAFKQEWEMLSFAYKWKGESKVHVVGRDDFTDKTDKSLVKALWALLNEADATVAHNGDQFDDKKSRAKFIEHDLPPPAPYKTIDTKKIAKNNFQFNSNSLNDLGKTLKLGKKIETGGFELWLKCMAGDPAAWRKMKRYNKQDVILLEKVYNKLKIWDARHLHLSAMEGKPEGCPVCGSNHVQSRGLSYTRATQRRKFQCMDCNHWHFGPTKPIK